MLCLFALYCSTSIFLCQQAFTTKIETQKKKRKQNQRELVYLGVHIFQHVSEKIIQIFDIIHSKKRFMSAATVNGMCTNHI